jgi:hypothetical protein
VLNRFTAHSLSAHWSAWRSIGSRCFCGGFAVAALSLLSLGLASCGGGSGGGGGDTYATLANSDALIEESVAESSVEAGTGEFAVNLRWRVPVTRLNGEALAAEDIRGHILISFSESELANNAPGTLGERIGTPQAFYSSQEDLGQFIASQDLPELVTTGLPNIILIQAPQSTYRIEGLDHQTYYFAVSTYDWYGLYSPLSETVKVAR